MNRRTCKPIRFTEEQRERRPKCARCHTRLMPETHHAYHPTADDGPKAGTAYKGAHDATALPVVAASEPSQIGGGRWATAYWRGTFRGYGGTRYEPIFCSLRCAEDFACLAWAAGYRVGKPAGS